MTPDILRSRARRGAELLDRARPGWAREIDESRLLMSHCHECILGQLYSLFACGLDSLAMGLETESARNNVYLHGFNLFGYERTIDGYAALADVWRLEIAARLAPEPR